MQKEKEKEKKLRSHCATCEYVQKYLPINFNGSVHCSVMRINIFSSACELVGKGECASIGAKFPLRRERAPISAPRFNSYLFKFRAFFIN
jgi:hypothetical protein